MRNILRGLYILYPYILCLLFRVVILLIINL
nr:MAG TPA: hypothetical protein [Caudoviricetes sp.]